MFNSGFVRIRSALLVLSLATPLACGGPTHGSAAPDRARIGAAGRELSLPPDIAVRRNRWVRASLGWVSEALDQSPPDTVRSPLRKLALGALDDALHLVEAPDIGAVADFFHQQVEMALAGIEGPPPRRGARIWKLYNHGFVVRTAGHCYAFDIFPGVGATTMSPPQMERLAGAVEVLFISHRHRDHASREFARLMLERGKPVVINPDIWPGYQVSTGKLIRIGGNDRGRAGAIGFRVFDGHQEDIPNNVYLVRTDGVSVMHAGDQYNHEDFDNWITGFAGGGEQVDVLLPNCWTLDIGPLVAQIKPVVVITGHENELGHVVYKRESYGKSYRRLNGLAAPYVMMTWGENFHYNR